MAEEPTNTTETQAKEQTKEQPEKEAQKTFTREELGQIVSAQIAKERKRWEEEHQSDIEKAKEDGKAEASMTAKQLAEKQAEDQANKLNQREDALNKRQQELDRRDHIAHTKDLLTEQDLPTDSAEMLLGETEDDTKANIQRFKELVNQGVRNELHKSSAEKSPQLGSPANNNSAPKKDMAEMTYDEMKAYLESHN